MPCRNNLCLQKVHNCTKMTNDMKMLYTRLNMFLLFSFYFHTSYSSGSMKHLTLNSFQNKPWFLHVHSSSLLKTLWKKEKLLVTTNFSFSHSVFYPFGELSAIFIKFEIVVSKVFQFGRVIMVFFGKRVKDICFNP